MTRSGVIRLETNPEVGSGWPLRWRFTCPRCHATRVHTNKDMLSLFLYTIYDQYQQVKSQGRDRAVSEKPPRRRLPSMRVVPNKTRRGGNLP